MRTYLLSTAALLGIFLAPLAPVMAQQPATEAPPPPQMEQLEEGDMPAITIRKPGEGKGGITEKRERGRVTEIRVQSGGSTYYLKPNDQPGTALPGDAQASLIRAPQWEVMEFDLKRPNDPASGVANANKTPVAVPAPQKK